ncbi:MAG: hypothetical protein ABIX28_10480 [Vicinamibacterales bacterium]
MPAATAGLCAACLHARVITSSRGAHFLLCQFSTIDPRYPRYPALPVRRCAALTPRIEPGGAR